MNRAETKTRAGESVATSVFPSRRRPRSWVRVLIYAFLLAGALAAVTPFVYMIMTSLKTYGSVINNNIWPWFPFGDEPLQFNNYAEAIDRIGFDKAWGVPLFVRYLANSIIMSSVIVGGVLITSILAAYVLARMQVPGKNLVFLFILATIMIPPDLTLVPKVVMMFNLKWYNTYLALSVPFLTSVFAIFLLRQFFMQIPKDLYDAARMDGAGHLRFLFFIVVPLSKPAIFTVALLNFIWAWDSFKWPLLVTRDNNMRVLAVGLQQFLAGEGGTNVQFLMAFATLVVLPIVILYFFTQKYFTEGVITTGLKG
ncbi:MAG: carbohydrate ABC transporter permease [Chloroflexi bacterium]|nr:carbohydrate ABC transporter permease [Chloroflexota bacterium]